MNRAKLLKKIHAYNENITNNLEPQKPAINCRNQKCG
jgi:hypothetical protein